MVVLVTLVVPALNDGSIQVNLCNSVSERKSVSILIKIVVSFKQLRKKEQSN